MSISFYLIIDPNITKRKKISHFDEENSTVSDDDSIILPEGNTVAFETSKSPIGKDVTICSNKGDEQITLQKITSILQENNKYILKAIQTSFQKEIENAISEIKANFKQSFKKILLEQTQFKQDISDLGSKIEQLQQKCLTLQAENNKLQKEIQHIQENVLQPNNQLYERVLVLHGFIENYWESDEIVMERVINIFYDILCLDLTGYIEGLTFIGKRSNKRPLKIELISKRMKKYILDNYIYLEQAGFSVTEYLSPQALQKRKKLKHALYIARKHGHHAIIRNNKLIINGKEATDLSLNDEKINTYTQTTEGRDDTKITVYKSPNFTVPISTKNTNQAITSEGVGPIKDNNLTSNSTFRSLF